jgi:hypothetical protein
VYRHEEVQHDLYSTITFSLPVNDQSPMIDLFLFRINPNALHVIRAIDLQVNQNMRFYSKEPIGMFPGLIDKKWEQLWQILSTINTLQKVHVGLIILYPFSEQLVLAPLSKLHITNLVVHLSWNENPDLALPSDEGHPFIIDRLPFIEADSHTDSDSNNSDSITHSNRYPPWSDEVEWSFRE